MKNSARFNILVACFLLRCFFTFGSNSETIPHVLLDSAHKAYSEKHFDRAVHFYNEVDSLGFESPELYYDIGNTYFKIGNMPMAILNFERAKKLNPDDADILFNLRLANQHIVDKTEEIPLHFISMLKFRILNIVSEKSWSTLSLFCFFLFLCFLALFFSFQISSRPSILIIAFVFLFFCFTSGFLAYSRVKLATGHTEAILISPNVTAKGSPDEKGTDLFIIHEGTKISLLQTSAGWAEIRVANGNTGWLPVNAFIVI
jgi:tetratricopeptide (TPR) repeat protein